MSAPEVPSKLTDEHGRTWTLVRAAGSLRSDEVVQFAGTFTLVPDPPLRRNPFDDPRVGDHVCDAAGDPWEVVAVARDDVALLYRERDERGIPLWLSAGARSLPEFRLLPEAGWSVDRLAGDA